MTSSRTDTTAWRSAAWAVAAGVALALAMPGPGIWPLVLVFSGLFLEALRGQRIWWRGGLIGWLAGTVHWLVTVSWVVDVLVGYGGLPILAGWGSLLLMAVILGSTWAVVGAVTVCAPGVWRLALLPAVWTLLEVARRLPPFLFPWNTTAAVLSGKPLLLGALPTWGATGQGWALVALGCALWGLFRSELPRRAMAFAGAVIMLQALALVAARGPESSADDIEVAVIQPGTSLEERWNPAAWPETAERVWRLSASVLAEDPDVLFWPESAMPFRFDGDSMYRRRVLEIARRFGTTVVLNSVAEAQPSGFGNAAFAVTSSGGISRYDKIRLVPFGEYVPSWAKWFFPDALVREVSGFVPGADATPLDAGVPLGMAVCYEVVFPELAFRQVREGAELLATLTNDAWYGDSWALDQHFAQAILRAVETRRWVVRAALTGISGVIDPTGKVIASLGAGEQGAFVETVVPSRQLTLVARIGDWWVWVCVLSLIILWLPKVRRLDSSSGPAGSRARDR